MASGIRAGVCVPGIGASGVNAAAETAARSMADRGAARSWTGRAKHGEVTNNENRLENGEVAFRIKTSRIEYHLKPQDEVGGNAEDWVEEITEVMLAAEEGDDDDADRDYGAFMGDYNEVVPANEASRRPP